MYLYIAYLHEMLGTYMYVYIYIIYYIYIYIYIIYIYKIAKHRIGYLMWIRLKDGLRECSANSQST